MFRPARPYPLWDDTWDAPASGAQSGPCRHLLLVRHGQYDEGGEHDDEQGLTELGQRQARLTGRRLAAMSAAATGVRISRLHVSGMRRARETAEAIAQELPPDVLRTLPDPKLNEGIPALRVPGPWAKDVDRASVDGPRIEAAFRQYFHRGSGDGEGEEEHVCEVIVGHGNAIRYFVCRALQLPPEAWLRMRPFNCSITYLIIMPNGEVQVRFLGDVGHLPDDLITFSGRRGWNWHGKITKCLPRAPDAQAAAA